MRTTNERQWQVAKLSLRLINQPETRVKANTSKKAHQVFMSMWDKDDLYLEERLAAIFLNQDMEVVGYREISIGGLKWANVPYASITKFALLTHCSYVILAHNHPSGYVLPSPQDSMTTDKLGRLLAQFDITLYDHLILGGEKFYWSMRDNKDIGPFKRSQF